VTGTLQRRAVLLVGAPVAGAALRRYGPRRTVVTGIVLVVLGIAGMSRLGPAWTVTGVTFAVLGAGFATVMVTTTGTVVGDAPPGYAGVVGGLKQTAMNIGPAFGIAVAATMMPLGPSAGAASGRGPTVMVLAALTALGLLPASLLPSRT
jgi:predicted MFS family arabinose efflux permease